MKTIGTINAIAIAAVLSLSPVTSFAQDSKSHMTTAEVRAEVSEAMDAIADYSEQQSDEALAEAREALADIDTAIERQEQALRENWAEMSAAAREKSREQLQNLREARNELGERFGALQTGTQSAWEELKEGFSESWEAFLDAWVKTDTSS